MEKDDIFLNSIVFSLKKKGVVKCSRVLGFIGGIKMQELSEVFTGPEELEFAKKILSAVPDDIGESPFADACLSGIVLKAYINETSKITGPLAEVNAFIAEKETYCRDHNILEKLKNAGHIESGGCAGNDTLYIKARQH